jgi:hypothetical protein
LEIRGIKIGRKYEFGDRVFGPNKMDNIEINAKDMVISIWSKLLPKSGNMLKSSHLTTLNLTTLALSCSFIRTNYI